MDNFKLVLPEHLNHYQFLFGGYLLKFVDEVAYIAATLDFPDYNFVTIGMDHVEFRQTVTKGTILQFRCVKTKMGRTSVTYNVDVTKATTGAGESQGKSVFSTNVTLVRVDESGNKQAIAA